MERPLPARTGGLTLLSVWWVRLGIKLERIEPGIRSRMAARTDASTLKEATANPPKAACERSRKPLMNFAKNTMKSGPARGIGAEADRLTVISLRCGPIRSDLPTSAVILTMGKANGAQGGQVNGRAKDWP